MYYDHPKCLFLKDQTELLQVDFYDLSTKYCRLGAPAVKLSKFWDSHPVSAFLIDLGQKFVSVDFKRNRDEDFQLQFHKDLFDKDKVPAKIIGSFYN